MVPAPNPDGDANSQLRFALPDIDPSWDKGIGMFEKKPPIAPEASDSAASFAASATAGEQLHSLSWSDLVAKLEAARDLSQEWASHQTANDPPEIASFNEDCAHHLAEQQEPFSMNYELPVNLENSGNRKHSAGIKSPDDNANDRLARGPQ